MQFEQDLKFAHANGRRARSADAVIQRSNQMEAENEPAVPTEPAKISFSAT
jgi:hypothetical protein